MQSHLKDVVILLSAGVFAVLYWLVLSWLCESLCRFAAHLRAVRKPTLFDL